MKDHPILFSGPLVRAILSGQKTQTRRLLRVQPELPMLWYPTPHSKRSLAYDGEAHFRRGVVADFAPWKAGDRLWVRETWRTVGWAPGNKWLLEYKEDPAPYSEVINRPPVAADPKFKGPHVDRKFRWVPSIHMPRWASRIDLEILEVRVQRIQEISEEDARAEGVHEHPLGKATLDAKGTHKGAFLAVWEEINGARPGGSWLENPWVWAVTFRLAEK